MARGRHRSRGHYLRGALLGGVGDEEELDVINIAIADRHLPELQRLVDGISPEAVWIVERVVRGHGLAAPVVVAR
jgi:hypothetical protein